jgi:hypothetical protein
MLFSLLPTDIQHEIFLLLKYYAFRGKKKYKKRGSDQDNLKRAISLILQVETKCWK